eukprot:TRINITY_DN18626_c0_g1_i1.p1 TRINITY_DN18626_c0_g1~~TRINITY_DN18626_c0_g1_i1.p1  ORF type:complete len:302 (-),score=34.24 TRINITY_DN18626_c0_g1_i1:96-1001(-)
MPKSVSGISVASKHGSKWRAVWCTKRCFKPDQARTLNDLEQLVKSTGGFLSCMKGAQHLRHPRFSPLGDAPHILITDWREAKPCLLTLHAEIPPHEWPVSMIVACENRELCRRASLWQQSLENAHTQVLVCLEDELGEMIRPGSPLLLRIEGRMQAMHDWSCNNDATLEEHGWRPGSPVPSSSPESSQGLCLFQDEHGWRSESPVPSSSPESSQGLCIFQETHYTEHVKETHYSERGEGFPLDLHLRAAPCSQFPRFDAVDGFVDSAQLQYLWGIVLGPWGECSSNLEHVLKAHEPLYYDD